MSTCESGCTENVSHYSVCISLSDVTVTIDCGDSTRLIMCYRLAGEGAKDLKVGDTITVTGIMKNYKGTIEFDAGCELVKVVKG